MLWGSFIYHCAFNPLITTEHCKIDSTNNASLHKAADITLQRGEYASTAQFRFKYSSSVSDD